MFCSECSKVKGFLITGAESCFYLQLGQRENCVRFLWCLLMASAEQRSSVDTTVEHQNPSIHTVADVLPLKSVFFCDP